MQTLPGVQMSSMSSQQSPCSRHDGSQRQKVGGAKHNPCTSRSQHSAKPASTHDPARVDAGTGAEKKCKIRLRLDAIRPVQKGSPDRLSSSRRLRRKSALSISTRCRDTYSDTTMTAQPDEGHATAFLPESPCMRAWVANSDKTHLASLHLLDQKVQLV